ncbi:uncharacterized protein LOC100836247 [Brachypodium distachyon]|uniref:Late embryogenesis abundant protein LEA-2 subgroup domain-containing protein n=1 Tax=Brachypodium distachyon TaxID=15368 RepID=I1HVK0_BRADI|nr:uncharacterized protein LOC100836247 [Brachypodium distachyon]KQK11719.1 hypothetical protein BRADI_2g61880v3 [Brachypodium distachyon]|eukprot:XP_003567518.1 uncharacterized protein LOC100836247 [Brachypodium distachyon]
MARQLVVVALLAAAYLAALCIVVVAAPPPPPPPPPASSFRVLTPQGRLNAETNNCGKRKCVNVKCDSRCPDQCFLLCPSCKTLCMCDFYPGISCGDPRFTGGDGNNFYFHGKKDKNFCILSDIGIHVNAHFIGTRNHNTSRDFTWIQTLGIRFANHRLFVGAKRTIKWNKDIDRLELALDDETIDVPARLGARWESLVVPGLTITRTADTNGVRMQLKGVFDIMAIAVPVTKEDSRVHNYGVTDDDIMAHLDIGFRFQGLTDDVHGVLGQTYRPDYVNKLSVRASNPIMGGVASYVSSDIFATDCAVARFARHGGIPVVMDKLK